MQLIKQKLDCDFIIALKSNRFGRIEIDGIKQDSVIINSLQLGQQAVIIWLERLSFPAMLTKQVFKNGDGTQDELYLACSDMKLQYQEINSYYKNGGVLKSITNLLCIIPALVNHLQRL
jgi:hypothetical protein